MICNLPTYLQTHLSGPDRRIFYLTEEGEWYNEIPCCPMGSLPCSYSLSQSFSLQLAATKHGVHPDQGNPRSGACTCAYYFFLPLPFPPPRKYTQCNEPGKEIWILVRGVSAFYLSACPARLYCLQRWSRPNMSLVLVCVYACYWYHTAGSAASYFLFLLF